MYRAVFDAIRTNTEADTNTFLRLLYLDFGFTDPTLSAGLQLFTCPLAGLLGRGFLGHQPAPAQGLVQP